MFSDDDTYGWSLMGDIKVRKHKGTTIGLEVRKKVKCFKQRNVMMRVWTKLVGKTKPPKPVLYTRAKLEQTH